MSKILNFLKDSKVFFIATIDGDAPKVRPFGLFFEFENKLYFGVGDFKSSYKQLKKNPNFEISAIRNDTEWIRISAKAVFDNRPEVLEKAFETIPSLREQYTGKDNPNLATFYADSLNATIFDLNGKIEKAEL